MKTNGASICQFIIQRNKSPKTISARMKVIDGQRSDSRATRTRAKDPTYK
jgi:hypothetical protein